MTLNQVKYGLLDQGVDGATVSKFLNYLQNHVPQFKAFEAYAFELISKGAKRLASKKIAEDLRSDSGILRENYYKINNSWTAYFGRAFCIKHPQYAGLFEFKTIKGVK